MAKIQSSPEVVRQMKMDLNKMAKDLDSACGRIRAAIQNSSSEWTDDVGEQYRDLLKQICRLIESPIEPLQTAQPRLEKLAQSLDDYGRVRFR